MQRITVKSSAIASLGYNSERSELEVEFHGRNGELGSVFSYRPVPEGVYAAMLLPGASIGQIFHREVRANPLVTGVRLEAEATA